MNFKIERQLASPAPASNQQIFAPPAQPKLALVLAGEGPDA